MAGAGAGAGDRHHRRLDVVVKVCSPWYGTGMFGGPAPPTSTSRDSPSGVTRMLAHDKTEGHIVHEDLTMTRPVETLATG